MTKTCLVMCMPETFTATCGAPLTGTTLCSVRRQTMLSWCEGNMGVVFFYKVKVDIYYLVFRSTGKSHTELGFEPKLLWQHHLAQ